MAAAPDGVNDTSPTNPANRSAEDGHGYDGGAPHPERTVVDVRIGVTDTPREINLELSDDLDRAALKQQIEAALNGAVDVLWLTDKKGRDLAISATKIAFVEVGASEGERRIGFGG